MTSKIGKKKIEIHTIHILYTYFTDIRFDTFCNKQIDDSDNSMVVDNS